MPRSRDEKVGRRTRASRVDRRTETSESGYTPVLDGPHQLELKVRHELLSDNRLNFGWLEVHRVEGGVCLEGVVEIDDDAPDVCGLASRVSGVGRVVNRLVIRRKRQIPAKG